jgi:hypothetical protein
LSQLKELLGKYGALLTNITSTTSEKHYFWINSVKSHCYVAFENENGARAAKEALNNSIWPQSNPKQLKVLFILDLVSNFIEITQVFYLVT